MISPRINNGPQPSLLVRPHPFRTEGPRGYLLRLAEANWIPYGELERIGIIYDHSVMTAHGLLPELAVDEDLNQVASYISELLISSPRVWNHQYSRFCPHCLAEDAYWRAGWELMFHDACPQHGVWLIDQCSSCGEKVTWNRDYLLRCKCGSDLRAEQASSCPDSVSRLSSILLEKFKHTPSVAFPVPFELPDVEQTQRLIRYMGSYMDPEAGKNPLKIREVGSMSASWPITSLAAEVLLNWPKAFHQSIEKVYGAANEGTRRKIGNAFGRLYHYLYTGLQGAAYNPVRQSFEDWLSVSWHAGFAKRNSRLTSHILEKANWIPANLATETLGIARQRLMYLIHEGVIEGEKYVGPSGRESVMVRRDQLELARAQVDGSIDMKTAGSMLGLTKARMRLILRKLFPEAKKTGEAASIPWNIPRASVENLLSISYDIEKVSIPDEGCVSIEHILRYWAWTTNEIATLVLAARAGEVEIVNILDDRAGLSAWIFNEQTLKAWRARSIQGFGTWLSIPQMAKVLSIKQQSAYDLVRKHFIYGEILHHQPKGGVRVKRTEIEKFKVTYVFCTEISQQLGVSSRKAISILQDFYILPVSGPGIDGARQVIYLRTDDLETAIRSFISRGGADLRLI